MSIDNRKIQEKVVKELIHSLNNNSEWEVDQEFACCATRTKGNKSIFIAAPANGKGAHIKVRKVGKKDHTLVLDSDLGKAIVVVLKDIRDANIYKESLKVLKEVSTQVD